MNDRALTMRTTTELPLERRKSSRITAPLARRSVLAVVSALLLAGCTSGPSSTPSASASVATSAPTPAPPAPLTIAGVPNDVLSRVTPSLSAPAPAAHKVSEQTARVAADRATETVWQGKPLSLQGAALAHVDQRGAAWVFVYHSEATLSSATACLAAKPCSGNFVIVGVGADSDAIDLELDAALIP